MFYLDNMKKAIILVSVILPFILMSCSEIKDNSISFMSMNTFLTFRVTGKNPEVTNQKAKEKIIQLEKMISTTDSQSEVYRINTSNGEKIKISEETYNLLKFSMNGIKETEGAFNPWIYPVLKEWGFTTNEYKVPEKSKIRELMERTDWHNVDLQKSELDYSIILPDGMMVDLGAVGKGYAGDKAVEIFKENGIISGVLDLGGNIHLIGKKKDGSEWKVGLKNPWGGAVPVMIKASDCAVITSGGYERFFTGDDGKKYIHIFDGRTGEPVNGNVVSSTIITKSGIYGDYLSTAAFILGKEWIAQKWRENVTIDTFDFVMMFEDHSVCYSKGLEGRITFLEDFSSIERIE